MYEETMAAVSLYRMHPVTIINVRTPPTDVEVLGYNIPAQVHIYQLIQELLCLITVGGNGMGVAGMKKKNSRKAGTGRVGTRRRIWFIGLKVSFS